MAIPIGLLVNFSLRGVEIERLANFPQTVETVQIHDYLMEPGLKNLRLTDSCDEIKIINGICEVFNELGYGYLESVYLRALEFELGVSKFAFDLEKELDVFFEGKCIGKQKVNSIFNDKIWICLTSTTKQPKRLEKKVRSILKSTPLSCAVLANLNGNRPKIKIIQK
ncbi:MAG TPA: GxxExxY protein [Thiotrichaceae bacterium]|nr:GxxExxY protein [Thiotrichaceae bacterium]